MNPELHHRLAAQRRAEHLAAAERYRLVRAAAPVPALTRRPPGRPPVRSVRVRQALGVRLVLIGRRLLDGVSEPV